MYLSASSHLTLVPLCPSDDGLIPKSSTVVALVNRLRAVAVKYNLLCARVVGHGDYQISRLGPNGRNWSVTVKTAKQKGKRA